MYYELALLSVVIAGGYWGWFFVRDRETQIYGAMQLGAALLAGLGEIGRHTDARGLGLAGAIGLGAGACLIVLGPLLRVQARRLADRERYRLAGWLLDVADVLAPGAGAGAEKAQLAGMRELRSGNVQPAVDRLLERKQRAPVDVQLALDERISALYLSAQKWDEAIAHAEAHLFGAPAPDVHDPTGNLYFMLRRSLGFAPQIWIELLGAYGHAGNLDQAARMLARLEDACDGAGEGASPLLHRGRMIFLALAGRVDAVATLVAPARASHMTAASRAYWLAIAHERRGELDAARASYARARARSRGHARTQIDRAIERLSDGRGSLPAGSAAAGRRGVVDAHAIELPPIAAEVVARVEAAPPPVITVTRRRRWPPAAPVLVGALLVAAAAIALLVGDSTDVGAVVRAGAMVRGLVSAGEWWRLVSSIFVHIGGVHLMVNIVALWFVARFVEDLFGPARTIAIFGLAGVAGSVASFLASPAAVSAGASGALFGLIGAVLVELTWHRERHRAAWPLGVWGSLAIVTVALVAVGSIEPIVDQWAHGGGLAMGALAGFALSPHARWQRPMRKVAWATAALFALATLGAAALVAATPLAASLSHGPDVRRTAGTVSVVVPASWSVEGGQLVDPGGLVSVELERHPLVGGLAAEVTAWLDLAQQHARDDGFDRIAIATDHVVPLPPGWQGSELEVSAPDPDPVDARQRVRVVAVARVVGGDVVLARLVLPETIARDAPALFTRLLASVQ